MQTKILSFILSFMILFTPLTPAFAQDGMAAAEKLDAMEMLLYGASQDGSIMDRTNSLEDDVYGATQSENIIDRVDKLYDYLEGDKVDNGAANSFLLKLNAVDSKINKKITLGPVKTRIEEVEKVIFGHENSGSLKSRLDTLVETAYTDSAIPGESITIPAETLIKVQFTKDITSKTAQAGDSISYVVADNVFANNVLIIPKGALGVGTIKKVVQPRSFGRDGRIDLEFSHVFAMDGREVKVNVGDLAKQEAATAAGAAGATIGGLILFGPVGAIGGAFVTGKSVTIPDGAITYVQVTEDTLINGVVYKTDEEAATAE